MKKKNIWMAVITYESEVIFSKAYLSKPKAEKAIAEHLRKHEDFDVKDFAQACFWIGEKNLRFDLMVFDMAPEDFREVREELPYFRDDLPLKEKGLYRVIYEIDVGASSAQEAAITVYEMMNDSNSMPPVLDVIDNRGTKIRIDLSQRKQKGNKTC